MRANDLRVASRQAASLSHYEPTSYKSIALRAVGQQEYELRAPKLMICVSTYREVRTKISFDVQFVKLQLQS